MTTRNDEKDPRLAKALWRYEIISPYIALSPKRGGRRKLLEELASKVRVDADGSSCKVEAETLRAWARRYRRNGFQGLMDKERERHGVRVLDEQLRESLLRLKREVPERSLERIIEVAEELELACPGILRRSTVHRVLQEAGISERAARVPDKKDLDRFEADAPNDLWQSDMLVGPWLPDPSRPGKVKRANLYLFIDDHSRVILFGRFSFKENLPCLELVFREALRRWGIPWRVYYDNGLVYRSTHMQQIIAELGIHRIIHTQPYRPEGHGKIEALNRYIRSAFLAELAATNIETLDELNEAFTAWAEQKYNRRVHSETGQAPRERWNAGLERVRYAEDEKMRQAFLWKETRTPDKAGVFSLHGIKYQAQSVLGRKKVEVRYDPEALHEVEVRHKGEFVQRARPLSVSAWRRPQAKTEQAATDANPSDSPKSNYLGRIVAKHKQETGAVSQPADLAKQRRMERAKMDLALIDMLACKLDDGVVDTTAALDFLGKFGPFDLESAERSVDRILEAGERRDLHVSFYLDAIRAAQRADLQ